MQNEYFAVAYQTKKGYIFTFCSSFLAKVKGPELYKGSAGNTIPAQVQIVSVRGGLCCAESMSGQGQSIQAYGDNRQTREVSVTVTLPQSCPV